MLPAGGKTIVKEKELNSQRAEGGGRGVQKRESEHREEQQLRWKASE